MRAVMDMQFEYKGADRRSAIGDWRSADWVERRRERGPGSPHSKQKTPLPTLPSSPFASRPTRKYRASISFPNAGTPSHQRAADTRVVCTLLCNSVWPMAADGGGIFAGGIL